MLFTVYQHVVIHPDAFCRSLPSYVLQSLVTLTFCSIGDGISITLAGVALEQIIELHAVNAVFSA
jgi:hypothetical protein